jgi:hypothetical protein
MCFIYDGKLTQELKERVKDLEFVAMYKIFDVYDGKLNSPFFYKQFNIGYNVDDSCLSYDSEFEKYEKIEYCLHCFETKESAEEILQKLKESAEEILQKLKESESLPDTYKLIRIFVKSQDIIAKGPLYNFHDECNGKYNSIGVKALTITEEDYNNALKTEKE